MPQRLPNKETLKTELKYSKQTYRLKSLMHRSSEKVTLFGRQMRRRECFVNAAVAAVTNIRVWIVTCHVSRRRRKNQMAINATAAQRPSRFYPQQRAPSQQNGDRRPHAKQHVHEGGWKAEEAHFVILKQTAEPRTVAAFWRSGL